MGDTGGAGSGSSGSGGTGPGRREDMFIDSPRIQGSTGLLERNPGGGRPDYPPPPPPPNPQPPNYIR